LKLTQQRFNDHLATNAELSAAQVALESAKLKLNSLTQRGVGQSQTLKADSPGLVSKIDVQEGQIVPAGGPIVELVSGSQVQVNLGIEPAEVPFVKVGQDVKLTVIGGASGEPVTGKVRIVGQRVDPATRLAPVIVSLPPQ